MKRKTIKKIERKVLFPFAGAVLGILAGAIFGMDKGMLASAAFFGFVGFGLGYALHDFNWRRNRITAMVLLLAFVTPAIGFGLAVALQELASGLTLDGLTRLATVMLLAGPPLGGLLTLITYAIINTLGLIEEARGWPAGGNGDENEMEDMSFSGYGWGVEGIGHYINGFRASK